MKYFVHLAGKRLFLAVLATLVLTNYTLASEVDYQPPLSAKYDWGFLAKWSAIGGLAILGVAQLDNSESVFGGLYLLGSFYYLKEEIPEEPDFQVEDYIVPLGLATMSLVNMTLLQQDEERKSTIVFYNILGAGLVGSYWYFYQSSDAQMYVLPWVEPRTATQGLALSWKY